MGKKSDAMNAAGRTASSPRRSTQRRASSNDDLEPLGAKALTDDESDESDDDESTEAIRGEIAETRAEMSETIDEIQERLTPRRLMQDAKETVRDATVGKVTDMMNGASESAGSIVDRIRDNPLPAALIGVGAWWLFGRQNQRTVGFSRGSYSPRSLDAEVTRTDAYDWDDARTSGGVVDTIKQHPVPATLAGLSVAWWLMDRQRAGGSGERTPSGREYYGQGYRSAEATADGVREMAHDAAERVSDATERVQERIEAYSERAQTEFDRMLRDNPLALGAVAVVVGAALGMAVPETRGEQQFIGGVRDQIVDKAKDLADGAAEKVQQMASDLSDSVDRSTS